MNQIKIILVQTLYAGNIGSVCRAMKNMGLSHLVLVDPVAKLSDNQAMFFAASAQDILESVQICSSIEEAILGARLVIGTSARHRKVSMKSCSIDELLPRIKSHVKREEEVAILFGPEDSGLSNEMYGLCHYRLYIESHVQYPVLNIAMSVMVIAYSIFKYLGDESTTLASYDSEPEYPVAEEVNAFYNYLVDLMTRKQFYDENNPQLTLPKLKRIFSKAGLETSELRLLFGLFKALDKP